MDRIDRQTLFQCAEFLVTQAAKLREYEKLTEIAGIEAQFGYVAQVRRSKPHLERIQNLVQSPSTDQEIFDTLRTLLESVASPSL